MKSNFFFASILIFMFCVFAVAASAQTVSNGSIAIPNQIQVLEKQLDWLNQMNNKILDTIYWALGGLGAVFLTIVGLNFFQNFSLNKRKLDTLQEEIHTDLKQALSKFQEQNNKGVADLSVKMKTEIKTETQNTLALFKSNIKELEDDLEEVKRESLLRKALEYKNKNQLGYILKLIEVLKLDIKKGWDWRISKSLELILECLSSNAFTNAESLTDLQKALNLLSPVYTVHKREIEAKMRL